MGMLSHMTDLRRHFIPLGDYEGLNPILRERKGGKRKYYNIKIVSYLNPSP